MDRRICLFLSLCALVLCARSAVILFLGPRAMICAGDTRECLPAGLLCAAHDGGFEMLVQVFVVRNLLVLSGGDEV